MQRTDVLVVGGGIAGVSAAHHLAPHRHVTLVEAEPQLAQHTTGRSAALYLQTYGGPANQALTIASRDFLFDPPAELVDHRLLTSLPFLNLGGPDDDELVEAAAVAAAESVPSARIVDPTEARELCPALRADVIGHGVLEPDSMEIDVMALHQAFVRGARGAGADVRTDAAVRALRPGGQGWIVECDDGQSYDVAVVVDAAGAWGDVVADRAGVRPLGLRPRLRTAFTAKAGRDTQGWALVHTIDGSTSLPQCYFKPETGDQVLGSPADEAPSPPCDARPDELAVATAIDHINAITTLDIVHVASTWAGLRTFTPDRQPAIGWSADGPGFFWMVGQGGTGIQTAPASGALAASLILDRPLPPELAAIGFVPTAVDPARFTA